jgi:hypothetical protein
MMNKQLQTDSDTTVTAANMLELYNIPATNINYTLHNLCRELNAIIGSRSTIFVFELLLMLFPRIDYAT